jgi:hypothetical protein
VYIFISFLIREVKEMRGVGCWSLERIMYN